MKLNFINQFLHKNIAKQLRRPVGILAGKVGNEMNKTNEVLYDFTINEMHLKDDESILELGFGNGKFFDKIFSAANNLRISGLDFSREMVKAATANNTTMIQAGHLNLQLGSSNRIPYADNSFHKVFCINLVYFWEQPADHVKEIYRVLNPGGRFYTTIRSKETMTAMPFTKYGFTTYAKDEWISLLKENHFDFVNAIKTENEPDVIIDKKRYRVESICIAARKRDELQIRS